MYELFANYYQYHRQNEVYTGKQLTDLATAVIAAQLALIENDYYKSITIVFNGYEVETVTR